MNVNKAKILRVLLYTDTPVTYQILFASLGDEMSESVLWNNLQRLIAEKCVEEKPFRAEGIDPQDYRLSDRQGGHVPKVFYKETQRGIDKYEYFKEKGAI